MHDGIIAGRPAITVRMSSLHSGFLFRSTLGSRVASYTCQSTLASSYPSTLLSLASLHRHTALLKHILKTKHEDEDLNCAVIVNNMAELNIDMSLIDHSNLIQSEEAIVGMQN